MFDTHTETIKKGDELGSPSKHISGAPFVLIPDENIEEAKEEFKEFIFARFQGDIPSKGRVIGVVNAVWARNGPRIFVHKVGQGCFLLKVTNERTRNVLLSRPAWMIAGSPMFVAPWSSDFAKEEPQLTTAVVPVELRGVPYLLFNKQSLSRLATAIGKPVSLAPETERKENFEVAKIWVRVSLLVDLPNKIITGFSNGREVEVSVSYPWLPKKCTHCDRYGHDSAQCPRSTAIYKQADSRQSDVPRQHIDRPREKSSRSRGRQSKESRRTRSARSLSVKSNYHAKEGASTSTSHAVAQDTSDEVDAAANAKSEETPAATETITHTDCITPLGSDPEGCQTSSEQLHPQTVDQCTQHSMSIVDNTSENEEPVSKPVISLDRQMGYSSVTVFHEVNESSQAHGTPSTGKPEEPFFLVSNRKSSRKATKH